jgi:hypothetical protein
MLWNSCATFLNKFSRDFELNPLSTLLLLQALLLPAIQLAESQLRLVEYSTPEAKLQKPLIFLGISLKSSPERSRLSQATTVPPPKGKRPKRLVSQVMLFECKSGESYCLLKKQLVTSKHPAAIL